MSDAGRRFIASVFGPDVITEEGEPSSLEGPLSAEEALALARAVEKRRREFVAGRTLARRALARLGIGDVAIPMGEDRAPLWPAGVVGTISHTADRCGVAVARDTAVLGIGLDLERLSDFPPRVIPAVCRPEEIAWLESLPAAERPRFAALLFSAKEAVYKCQYPRTRRFLEFHDVELRVDAQAGTFAAHAAADANFDLWPADTRVDARFHFSGGHVVCGVSLLK